MDSLLAWGPHVSLKDVHVSHPVSTGRHYVALRARIRAIYVEKALVTMMHLAAKRGGSVLLADCQVLTRARMDEVLFPTR